MLSHTLKTGLLTLGVLGLPQTAAAQPEVRGVEQIDSERPEAWAAQYFTSTTLLGGFSPPVRREPGSVRIGAEIVWIPSLSQEQQRVGFNGTKLEDLNQAPLFVRPRVTVALPGAFAATVAFVPPVKTFGVTPKLVAVALERPIVESPSWSMGWRAYGQTGTAEAAITCSKEVAAFAAGTAQNPYGCLAPSADVTSLRYVGLEMSVGQSLTPRYVAPHVAAAVNYFDNQVELNSRRFGVLDGVRQEFVDRTIQRSHATRFSLAGGVAFRLGSRVQADVDLFYAPLWVRRAAGRQYDALLNAKMFLTYRIR